MFASQPEIPKMSGLYRLISTRPIRTPESWLSPEEGLTAAEEQDTDSHIVELLHLLADLLIGMHNGGDIVDGTVLALQIAFVCYNNRSQNRLFLSK